MGQKAQQTIQQKVYTYVSGRQDQTVGDGECWTLAETALKDVGAKTSNNLMGAQNVSNDVDYVWGTPINLHEVVPGDILQFSAYSTVKTTTVTVLYPATLPGGATVEPNPVEESEDSEDASANHHTAIVASKFANNTVTVLHQNFNDVKRVMSTKMYFAGSESTKTTAGTRTLTAGTKEYKVNVRITTKVKRTVSYSVKAYRPIEKK
jgi:hypothetical protein